LQITVEREETADVKNNTKIKKKNKSRQTREKQKQDLGDQSEKQHNEYV
jgi:hypothetical protein